MSQFQPDTARCAVGGVMVGASLVFVIAFGLLGGAWVLFFIPPLAWLVFVWILVRTPSDALAFSFGIAITEFVVLFFLLSLFATSAQIPLLSIYFIIELFIASLSGAVPALIVMVIHNSVSPRR